jgi:hypothetical protein
MWTIVTAVGEPAGFLPALSWGVTVAALVAFSFRRMERMEL